MTTEFMQSIPDHFQLPSPEGDYDVNLLEEVKRIGWHHVHITAEGEEPAFAFSIGHFLTLNHPEIIVLGLQPEIAQQFLNAVAVKLAGAKETIEPYKKYSEFTEGLSLAFIPVSLEYYGEYLGYANWFYGALPKPYPALQMIWPDKSGLYPWEQNYDTRFFRLQPVLGEVPEL